MRKNEFEFEYDGEPYLLTIDAKESVSIAWLIEVDTHVATAMRWQTFVEGVARGGRFVIAESDDLPKELWSDKAQFLAVVNAVLRTHFKHDERLADIGDRRRWQMKEESE